MRVRHSASDWPSSAPQSGTRCIRSWRHNTCLEPELEVGDQFHRRGAEDAEGSQRFWQNFCDLSAFPLRARASAVKSGFPGKLLQQLPNFVVRF